MFSSINFDYFSISDLFALFCFLGTLTNDIINKLSSIKLIGISFNLKNRWNTKKLYKYYNSY